MSCSFCIPTKREKAFMKVEDFEEIVKKIQGYTDLITLHVKGEPFMHPNLKELLQICEKYKLKVNITTNATLLSKQLQTIITSRAIRQINLSIHSIKQNGDNKLKEKEYVKQVIQSVRKITQETPIIISYRLWNLESIKENEHNKNILDILEKEYQITNLLERAKQEEYIKLDENVFLNQDEMFEWPTIRREIISKKGKCQGLRNQIAILVDGSVVPCCLDQDGDIVLGNILKDSLSSILESDQVKRIKNGFENNILEEPLCQRCGYRKKFK